MSSSSFRPSVHGWVFGNELECPQEALGLGDAPAPSFGLAGGMCWAALDRFLAGRRVPRQPDTPAPGSALHSEFIERQVNIIATGLWPRLRAAQALPDEAKLFRPSLARTTRAQWSKVRQQLDRDRPVLLCLVTNVGQVANPSANPQVLAYRYQIGDDRRVRLWLYDPARPGADDVVLTFDAGRWLRPGAPLGMALGSDAAVRGFIAVPYDRSVPIRFGAETFADRATLNLTRSIAGDPMPVLDGSGQLQLFARGENSELLWFRKEKDGWYVEDLTKQPKAGPDYQIYSRPAVAATGTTPEAFARGYSGDLIHYKRGLGGWSADNVTERKSIGLGHRFEGEPLPVVGPGNRITVLARTADERLVAYERVPRRGWRAADLTGPNGVAAAGPPAAVLDADDRRHAFVAGERGQLMHYHQSGDAETWSAEDLTALREPAEEFGVVGRPAAARGPDDVGIEVFCRNRAGELVVHAWTPARGWSGANLTRDLDGSLVIASDPILADGQDGTRHLFACDEEGGLVHFVRSPRRSWAGLNLTTSRAIIDPALRLAGPPVAAAGPGPARHVFASRGEGVAMYAWLPDTGWWAEDLSLERETIGGRYRVASHPMLLVDGDGYPHLFATDGRGMITHYWALREGETPPSERAAARAAVAAQAARQRARTLTQARRPRPSPSREEPAPAPLPTLSLERDLDFETGPGPAPPSAPPSSDEPAPAAQVPPPAGAEEPLPLSEWDEEVTESLELMDFQPLEGLEPAAERPARPAPDEPEPDDDEPPPPPGLEAFTHFDEPEELDVLEPVAHDEPEELDVREPLARDEPDEAELLEPLEPDEPEELEVASAPADDDAEWEPLAGLQELFEEEAPQEAEPEPEPLPGLDEPGPARHGRPDADVPDWLLDADETETDEPEPSEPDSLPSWLKDEPEPDQKPAENEYETLLDLDELDLEQPKKKKK